MSVEEMLYEFGVVVSDSDLEHGLVRYPNVLKLA